MRGEGEPLGGLVGGLRPGSAYALAITLTTATLLAHLALAGWIGRQPLVILFLLPILVSAYLGGLGPGLLSTALSAGAVGYFLTSPARAFSIERPSDLGQWLVLITAGVLASVFSGALHQARRAAEARWYPGRSSSTERKVRAGFAVSLVLLLAMGATSYWCVHQLVRNTADAHRAARFLAALHEVLAADTDAETAQRGYVITGQDEYRSSYLEASGHLRSEVEALRNLTPAGASDRGRNEAFSRLIERRLGNLDAGLELRQSRGFEAARAEVAAGAGRGLEERIRRQIATWEGAEAARLGRREKQAKRASVVAIAVMGLGGVLGFLLGAVGLFLVGRDFAGGRRAEAALREAHDQLEARVQERTAELALSHTSLRESEARFRRLAESLPQLIWTCASDGSCDYLSPQWLEFTGLSEGRQGGMGCFEPVHPADRQAAEEAWELAAAGGHQFALELRLRRHDGAYGWFDTRAVPWRDAGGGVVQWFGSNTDITERKEMEAQREMLVSLVEHSQDFIAMADLTGHLTYLNAGGRRMIGLGAEVEPTALHFTDYVPDSWREVFQEEVLRCIHEKGHWEGPMELRHLQTGAPVHVLRSTFLIRDRSSGEPLRYATVTRDISERKLAEDALRWRTAFFEAQVETSPDAVLVVNAQGRKLLQNARFLQLFKVPEALAVDDDDLPLLHHVVDQTRNPVEFAARVAFLYEHPEEVGRDEVTLLDGTVLDRYSAPVKDREGVFYGRIWVFRDITERKRTERRWISQTAVSRVLAFADSLDEATPRILQVLAQAEGWDFGAIWEVDDSLGGLRCSEVWHRAEISAQALAARTRELTVAPGVGLVGEVWAAGEVHWIPDVAAAPGYLRAALATQAELRSAIAFPILQGGAITGVVEFLARAIREPDDRLCEMLVTLGRQIGLFIQRRRAEEQVRDLNATLEGRVAERTAQLEAVNRELDSFSYSVAHDLRAPLRAVDGYSHALLEDHGHLLPPGGIAYLKTVRSETQRMGLLIDDLLSFSRLSRAAIAKQEVDNRRLVQAALGDFGAELEGRQVEIRVAELEPCEGDPALLRQVWANLLSNALKYTRRQAQAVVEIGCSKENGAPVYSVRDNGTGFDMRYADRLFGVFERLHSAAEYEGTGVGLAIVKRVVERHGGRVWAEGELGRGACFSFTLQGDAGV